MTSNSWEKSNLQLWNFILFFYVLFSYCSNNSEPRLIVVILVNSVLFFSQDSTQQ